MAQPIDKATRPVARKPSSESSDVAAFVAKVGEIARPAGSGQRGRLLFALDATMSRQPTWDLAVGLQAEMFSAIPRDRALDVQLLYFRGHGECRSSKWVADPEALARIMSTIACRGGNTQVSKVFAHARRAQAERRLNAVIYVGDAIEESVDDLCHKAGELGLLGVPMFVFQEGHDTRVEAAFREFARLTKGAYARFDPAAPRQLADLLRAVAAFASGGRDQLKLETSAPARALLAQLK